ncbi:MAG: CCA tRNA nucleotidyltransferase [Acidobacteriota bacterium]|nr:CCA tRNA nucleotidyltransferase [Acidobacteriota bacterium]
MADYIYLLENRLSAAQRNALATTREVARAKGLTVFLVGGAVRDMTSGSPVRDLDVAVQGNALKLKKDIEKAGGEISGEHDAGQALFVRFPGGVRMEIGSTLTATYPKPGKPVVKPASILEDLRRRDFTANAMALSLNDGSYGLLMDPLNGVADIENRELRLVSNYGFIEDPIRMIRAARLMARLGWQMDEKTQARYETGKQEGYISAVDEFHRGYETEEIFHEEDPLRVLRRLEAEGWMKHLFPALSATKANVTELEKLRESQTQLEMQGIHPDPSTANFPLLTGKLAPKDIAALKTMFARQGFVAEIGALEAEAKVFAAEFSGKGAGSPSQAWKLLHSAKPESVLWIAHTSKNPGIQAKFKGFYTEWAQAKQKLPYTMMQEMRIVPELPGYHELLDKLFFELMDSRLTTPEEMKAYLEPYSPPAPPPPVHLRRPRMAKKDSKPAKSRKKASVEPEGEPGVASETATVGQPAEGAKPVKAAASAKVLEAATKAPGATAPTAKKTVPAKVTPARVAGKGNPPAGAKASVQTASKAASKSQAGAPSKAAAKAAPKKAGAGVAGKAAKSSAKKADAKASGKRPPVKGGVNKGGVKSAAKKAAKVPGGKQTASAKKKPAAKPTSAKKPASKAPAAKKNAAKKTAPKKRR